MLHLPFDHPPLPGDGNRSGVHRFPDADEGAQHSRVTFETRLHPRAPFGVVAARVLFEVTAEGTAYAIDSRVTLVEAGDGAKSWLERY